MLYAYLLQLRDWVKNHFLTILESLGHKKLHELELSIPGKEEEVRDAFYYHGLIFDLHHITE